MGLQEILEAAAKLLHTSHPIHEGHHAKGRAQIHHSVKRAKRARRRGMSRHSRRVNRHRSGRRRSTRAPRS